jgi:hypothetical protein
MPVLDARCVARTVAKFQVRNHAFDHLESVEKEVESGESYVIQEVWPDSGGATDVDER